MPCSTLAPPALGMPTPTPTPAHRLVDEVPCHDGWIFAVPPPRDGVGARDNRPAAQPGSGRQLGGRGIESLCRRWQAGWLAGMAASAHIKQPHEQQREAAPPATPITRQQKAHRMKSLNSALGASFEKKSLWEPPVRLANWSTPPVGVQLEVKERMTWRGGWRKQGPGRSVHCRRRRC